MGARRRMQSDWGFDGYGGKEGEGVGGGGLERVFG